MESFLISFMQVNPWYHSQQLTIPERMWGVTMFREVLWALDWESKWSGFHIISVGKFQSLISQLIKLKFFLELVFNDYNIIIILFLSSRSFLNWKSFRERRISSYCQHLPGTSVAFSRFQLPGDVCVCYTGSVWHCTMGELFFRLCFKKKGYF
jgi:hypothetical protein